MHIDFSKKIGGLLTPKCGSQTIAELLQETYNFKPVGGHHDGPCNLRHSLSSIHTRRWTELSNEEQDEFQWFTLVRDPFDLLHTWWNIEGNQERYPSGITGNFIVEQVHRNSDYYPRTGQLFRFLHDRLPGKLIRVIRYERLIPDFDDFMQEYGYDPLDQETLPWIGREPTKDRSGYVPYWTEGGLNYFHRVYRKELTMLGYMYDPNHRGEEAAEDEWNYTKRTRREDWRSYKNPRRGSG
jgi:hypothetical protein